MSNRDDDDGRDFNLTVPDIQLPGRGASARRPPEDDFERTNYNLPPARREPGRQPPTPPSDYGLTSYNLHVPPGAYEDDEPVRGQRPAPPPASPPYPPPPSQPYPPQQYPQQPYARPPQQPYAQPPQYPSQAYGQQPYAPQPQYPPQPYAAPPPAYAPAPPAAQPASPQEGRRRPPAWAWVGGALLGLVLVAAVAAALYFFWPFGSTFTLRVLNAPRGSRVYVDDVPTGVSQADGSITVQSLRADEQREVRVTHEGYADWRTTVKGQRGETRELRVKLTPVTQEPAKAAESEITKDLEEMGRARVYGVNFDTGSDVIRDESKPTLDQIVAALKQRPEWKLVIEGHTDSTASAAFNQQLSERRAAAVKNYLQANGVDGARLSTVGFGASKPISDNNTPVGRALNRRVELIRQ